MSERHCHMTYLPRTGLLTWRIERYISNLTIFRPSITQISKVKQKSRLFFAAQFFICTKHINLHFDLLKFLCSEKEKKQSENKEDFLLGKNNENDSNMMQIFEASVISWPKFRNFFWQKLYSNSFFRWYFELKVFKDTTFNRSIKGLRVDFESRLLTVSGCFWRFTIIKSWKKWYKVKNRKTGIFENYRFFHRRWKLMEFSESTVSKTPETLLWHIRNLFTIVYNTRIGQINLTRYHQNQSLIRSWPKLSQEHEVS